MISKLVEKLSDSMYRQQFVAAEIEIGIPFQLRAMMKARGWTQGDLAARVDMLQPRISALLAPGKIRPNIATLRRLAHAFDCALIVQFAPFSQLIKSRELFDPESFDVASFENELAAGEFDIRDVRELENKVGGHLIATKQRSLHSHAPVSAKASAGAPKHSRKELSKRVKKKRKPVSNWPKVQNESQDSGFKAA